MAHRRFEGKVAVVTGGNSGIGFGVAKAYAAEGARVAISGRNEKTIQSALKELGPDAWGMPSDASKVADIQTFFGKVKERFGKVDALFVNAGIGKFVPFEQVSEEFFDQTLNTNLKGVFFTVQKAVPLMPHGSAIVLNASVNAHMGMPNSSVYGATKAAVVNLAQTLAADLLEKGIRVNAVSPGPIASQLLNRMGVSDQELKQTKDWITSQVPLKRFGTPEELANAVLFLTSPESAFILGTELIVDGGMTGL
jgi:NAD(P)-dependent dehydrogenase (short-subunit alcohol dehydrogenase family)